MNKSRFLLALCLSVASHMTFSQNSLPDIPNVEKTIGNASSNKPLSFCTGNEISSFSNNLSKDATFIAWEIEKSPSGIGNIVAISDLKHPGCSPVQPLPSGGVMQIKLRTPYAIVDNAPDWSKGFSALVMTKKNPAFTDDAYVARLKRHVNLVTKLFSTNGMDGYFVYAGEDHEWAYLHWKDEETAKRAFASPDGATGPQDSKSIQDALPRKQIPAIYLDTTSSVKMIKRASLLARKPGQSRDDFVKHWLEVHAPIAKSIPGIYKYTCTVVTKSSFRKDGPAAMDVEVDGIAEMWFVDQASFDAAIKSPAFAALRADGAAFIGREIDFITEENVIVTRH
jgi:uncharacterized protein (TIGR02118 family)